MPLETSQPKRLHLNATSYLTTDGSNSQHGYYDRRRMQEMQRVLSPIATLLADRDPTTCLCIGAGGNKEPATLQMMFPSLKTIVALDLSHDALRDARKCENGLTAPVEADAVLPPVGDNTVDIVVAKSVLHEVTSYTPDGVAAWNMSIYGLTRSLRPKGVFYYLDFAAPEPERLDYSKNIDIYLRSEHAQRLYNLMREYYRTFDNGLWEAYDAGKLTSVRDRMDNRFRKPSYGSVSLSPAMAAEFFLHLPPYVHDHGNKIFPSVAKDWKEMQEMYFMRDEEHGLYTPQEQVAMMSSCLGYAGINAEIKQSRWHNYNTNLLLADHISARGQRPDGSMIDGVHLFDEFTQKLIVTIQKND